LIGQAVIDDDLAAPVAEGSQVRVVRANDRAELFDGLPSHDIASVLACLPGEHFLHLPFERD